MKALSIKQPWASLVAAGYKTVECRTWKTNYRGPLLVCASKGDWEDLNDNQKTLVMPGGYALGVVELVDVRPMTKADIEKAVLPLDMHESALKGYAWHVKKLYEIVPFPIKGKLNLFNVALEEGQLERLPDNYPNHAEYYTQNILKLR